MASDFRDAHVVLLIRLQKKMNMLYTDIMQELEASSDISKKAIHSFLLVVLYAAGQNFLKIDQIAMRHRCKKTFRYYTIGFALPRTQREARKG